MPGRNKVLCEQVTTPAWAQVQALFPPMWEFKELKISWEIRQDWGTFALHDLDLI